MNLEQLRKFRNNKDASLSKIVKAIEENTTKSYADDRFWSATADKAGNASAVIRFLPSKNLEDLPFVKIYSHAFKGPSGKWYIENCLTTIGKEDPVVEHTTELWNSGLESDKDIARDRKRKLSYISNVLVINDPTNPENNGKVFLFKYGKKIFDMISDIASPQFEDENPCDVFNPFEGANFRLKMRRVEGYANFDKSSFDTSTELADTEEEMMDILSKCYDLNEFISPNNFKAYEDLKKRLDFVLNNSMSAKAEDVEIDTRQVKKEPVAKSKPEKVNKVDMDDDDIDLEFFQELVNE